MLTKCSSFRSTNLLVPHCLFQERPDDSIGTISRWWTRFQSVEQWKTHLLLIIFLVLTLAQPTVTSTTIAKVIATPTNNMIATLILLHHAFTLRAPLEIGRLYEREETRIVVFCTLAPVPCGFAFGTGHRSTSLATSIPVVYTVRSYESRARGPVAVSLISSLQFQLFRSPLPREGFGEAFACHAEWNPGGATGWRIECFVFNCAREKELEAVWTVQMGAGDFGELVPLEEDHTCVANRFEWVRGSLLDRRTRFRFGSGPAFEFHLDGRHCVALCIEMEGQVDRRVKHWNYSMARL